MTYAFLAVGLMFTAIVVGARRGTADRWVAPALAVAMVAVQFYLLMSK